MRVLIAILRWVAVTGGVGLLVTFLPHARAQTGTAPAEANIVVLVVRGTVEYTPKGGQRWVLLHPNDTLAAGDRVRVGPRSQLGLRFADQSIARFDEKTEFELQAPAAAPTGFRARVVAGFLYFFHRDKPSQLEVETRLASAAVRGTEFALRVEADGTTELTVIEGEVEMASPLGSISLKNGEQGVAKEGEPLFRRAALDIAGAIQWTLYYPGVLDLNDLPLEASEFAAHGESLKSYRAGDLIGAAEARPANRLEPTDAERIYRAALALAVGQVEEAESDLRDLRERPGKARELAEALRVMAEIVKRGKVAPSLNPQSATGWLVESYRLQGQLKLEEALAAARASVTSSPEFAFAWTRVAELEFGFGRIEPAARALKRALELSPSNAQAIALDGFLLAARNRMAESISRFEEAMAADGTLANAWLGRGLARIRLGRVEAGRADLLAAAALEPRRSALRSYLGKAWTDARQWKFAEHELVQARDLDPLDPTPWLYAALLKEQHSRINEAVRDLERSQQLNDNRAVYRSRFQLEQDQAVRSANLARIYRDAGMSEWAVNAAGRSASADYANYSAHLFLADSYSLALDPIGRRWETPMLAEYLIANLLAPVNAGVLSSAISQHEYSNLFERNRTRFVSTTEYLSRGAWTESAAIFGTEKHLAYSVEGYYRDDPGQRPNNDLEQRQWSFQIKPRLTAQDTLFVRAEFGRLEGGDLSRNYDPKSYNSSYRFKEEQEPALFLGYHHEWSPESKTLVLASRADHFAEFTDSFRRGFLVERAGDRIITVQNFLVQEQNQNRIEVYSLEPQHIWQTARQSTIVGVRGQQGKIRTEFTQADPGFPVEIFFPFLPEPSATADLENEFNRISVYGYHQHQVAESLRLVAGLSYDLLRFPQNWRNTPIGSETQETDQISPKAGLVWTPNEWWTARGFYSRSLGGATIDQSYQIEPTEVAGFNQSFRSVIPETLAGGNSGAEFETYALSLERRLRTGTFLILGGDVIGSQVERTIGTFDRTGPIGIYWSGLEQELDYSERSAHLTVHQLLGNGFALGARYRVSRAELESFYPQVSEATLVLNNRRAPAELDESVRSLMHEVRLSAIYNHGRGFFGEVAGTALFQSNRGYSPDLPGDSFWQMDVVAGWRSQGRNIELSVGLLNVTDEDYRISPLNIAPELPRERTLVARLRTSF